MARGAGGLRHVGAAARAPTAAGMLQPYSDGLARDRCATAAAEILLPVITLPAAYLQAARAGAGCAGCARGFLEDGRRYRYFLPVLSASPPYKNTPLVKMIFVARSPLQGRGRIGCRPSQGDRRKQHITIGVEKE